MAILTRLGTITVTFSAWLLACNPVTPTPGASASGAASSPVPTVQDSAAEASSDPAAVTPPDAAPFDPQSSCGWGDPAKLGWTPAVCRALTKAEGDKTSELPAESASESSDDAGTQDSGGVAAKPESYTGRCPPGMIYVHGIYCGLRRFKCKKWIEDPAKNPFARCGAYEKPSRCSKLEPKVYKEFCIDKYEAAGADGLPLADKSWNQATRLCKAAGKRLCKASEWTLACEGEEGRPYPYGYVRNNEICNFEITDGLIDKKGKLADHREPVKANPKCVSPFGVQNMVGNIDEWVELDRPYYSHRQKGRKMMSGLKGGWWGPLRNRCRPVTVDHDEVFHELQTGFRCCKDAKNSINHAELDGGAGGADR